MSIRCNQLWVIYQSTTMQAIEPEYLGIDKETIEQYLAAHPMPEDEAYSKEDLIHDITNSTGMLTLGDELQPATRQFVADMIQELI